MTDFQSNPETDDELLSAYLDDELSPDERARVDARLAADPAARQTLDQLRAASQAMHSLPQETVGQDLRESILRRAEAAMLTSHGRPSAAAATKSAATNGTVGLRDALPRLTIGQTRRGWVWAALAIAAGLLIMVVQPGDRQANNLPPIAASRSEEAPNGVAVTDGADVPALRKSRITEPAATPATADHNSFADTKSATAASAPVASREVAPPPSTIALDVAAPSAATTTVDSLSTLSDGGGAIANDSAALVRAPAPTGKFDVAGAQPAREGGAQSEALAMRQLAEDAKEAKDANGRVAAGATSGPAPETARESGRRFAETPPQGAVGGEVRLGAAAGQPAPADGLVKAPAQAQEQDFVVVHVVATPEALRNKSFDRVLINNGILLEQPPTEEAASDAARKELAENEADVRRVSNRPGVTRGQPQDESDGRTAEDVVIVAAPKSVIESCLAELKKDHQSYLGVSVDDATAQSRMAGDKAVLEVDTNVKNLATDLGTRFNRGTAPPQDAELSRQKYFYDYYAGRGEGPASGRGIADGFGGGALKQEQEQLRASAESSAPNSEEKLAQGRARRVRSWSFDNQSNRDRLIRRGAVADDRSSSSTPRQFGAVPQEAQAPAEAAGDRLYVLFVLSPGTEPPAATPPSPPAENRQE